MPKVSVIIPVYNSEEYLEKCLDSVLGQDVQDIEIIIVNDGSPDNSQEIIDRYTAKHSDKIKAFTKENGGQSSARNMALSFASGEFIAFVDSDDYLEPDMLKTSLSFAEANDYDIVCFDFWQEKEGIKTESNYRFHIAEDTFRTYILNETSPCNKIIKRKIFEENNLRFTENSIYEDLELIPQLANYTQKIGFLDDKLYNYVIHENSTMRQASYNPKMEAVFRVSQTLWKAFADTEYKSELEFLFIEHLLHAATLRFLPFKEGRDNIKKLSQTVKEKFPRWRKNKYFRKMHWKYKLVCLLAYYKKIKLLGILLGV